MTKLIECVPNFSNGLYPEVLDKIVSAIKRAADVWVLGKEMDADHNRSVVTFVGTPEAVLEASYYAIVEAKDMIDINNHKGEHPRIGATDVCPFIPFKNTSMEDCIEIANKLGQRVGETLQIPVFLYEEAALRPERKNLANIRQIGFEKLRDTLNTDETWQPDFGPNIIHPTAGAICIGARFFLIAYNVNLDTTNVKLAKAIAKKVRERDGGFPRVKALGMFLEKRNIVQVSMNITDYRKVSLREIFNKISEDSAKAQVSVIASELVGFVPEDFLIQEVKESVKLENFSGERILECQLQKLKNQVMTCNEPFLDALASPSSVPGGGGVAALSGAMAAALGEMVISISKKKPDSEEISLKSLMTELRNHLHCLVQADSNAYSAFVKSRKMPKNTEEEKEERRKAIEDAIIRCIIIPVDVMKSSVRILQTLPKIAEISNKYVISDLGIACSQAVAAITASTLNIKINLKMVNDNAFKEQIEKEVIEAKRLCEEIEKEIQGVVEEKMEA